MPATWQIDCDCALVFGDVHQRLNWADAVLAHEAGRFDRVIFLGDIAHSHDAPPAVAGLRDTADWYARLIERTDSVVLMGNHDMPFFESDTWARRYRKKIPLLHGCTGFRHNHAIEFAKEVGADHWKKVRLFTVVNGWLCSHAGVHPSFWRPVLDVEQNLSRLWEDATEALQLAAFRRSPLLACGPGRTDTPDGPIGGLTWCDWDDEFVDSPPPFPPQLVGHSSVFNCHRQKGRSWCIDSGVGYALLHRDGRVEHKSLVGSRVAGEWVWTPAVPQISIDSQSIGPIIESPT